MFGKNFIAAIAVVTSVGVATMPTAEAGLGHWLSHVGSSKLDQFAHSAVGALSIGAGVAAIAGGIILIGVPGVGAAGIVGGMALLGAGTGGEVFGFHEMFLSDAAQTKAEQQKKGTNVSRNANTNGARPGEPPEGQGVANAGFRH